MIKTWLAKRWLSEVPKLLDENEYVEIVFDSGRVYLDVTTPEHGKAKGRPVYGFYSNAAFYHRKYGNELNFKVIGEQIEEEGRVYGVETPADAHRTLEASNYSDAENLDDVADTPINANQLNVRWFSTDYIEKAIMDAPTEALTVRETGLTDRFSEISLPMLIGGALTLVILITGVYALMGGA